MPTQQDAQLAFGTRVGERLRTVRCQRKMSLRDVADASGGEFKWSVLGAYERGSRSISVLRLQRLAELYGVPVERLLPVVIPVMSSSNGRMRLSTVRVDLAALENADGLEATAVRSFVDRVRGERQDYLGQVTTMRGEDVRVLGAVLGLREDQMVRKLFDLGVLVLPPAR